MYRSVVYYSDFQMHLLYSYFYIVYRGCMFPHLEIHCQAIMRQESWDVSPTFLQRDSNSNSSPKHHLTIRMRQHPHTITNSEWHRGIASHHSLKIIGLFCERALLKRLYPAKETYNFKRATTAWERIIANQLKTHTTPQIRSNFSNRNWKPNTRPILIQHIVMMLCLWWWYVCEDTQC